MLHVPLLKNHKLFQEAILVHFTKLRPRPSLHLCYIMLLGYYDYKKMPDNDLGNGAGGKILNENLTQAEASLTTKQLIKM